MSTTKGLPGRLVLARKPKDVDFNSFPDTPKEVADSYFNDFLQLGVSPSKLRYVGIHGVLANMFPAVDYEQGVSVEYVNYRLGEPQYSREACIEHSLDYSVPIYAKFRVLSYKDGSVNSIMEDEVELGLLPMMGEDGTFIKNGSPWIVISQIVRSPGVYFEDSNVRLVPKIGRWLTFEVATNRKGIDGVLFRVDNNRLPLPVTTLLYALGLSMHEIVSRFFMSFDTWHISYSKSNPSKFRVKDDTGRVVDRLALLDRVVLECDNDVLLPTDLINDTAMDLIVDNQVRTIKTIKTEDIPRKKPLLNTIRGQKELTQERAMLDIFKRLNRYNQKPKPEEVITGFSRLFFTDRSYSLSESGRVKLSLVLGREVRDTLDVETICDVLALLFKDNDQDQDFDMSGRRVKFVGDLFEQVFAQGVAQLRSRIYSFVSSMEHTNTASVSLSKVISPSKYITAAMRKFMNNGELVRMADQTNPLSETAHKLRLTMGGHSTGGMKANAIPVEARYIVPNQFGRISPLETPDGKNVGIDNLIAMYAKRGSDGFLHLPVNPVRNGIVHGEVKWISPYEDKTSTIVRRDQLGENGSLPNLVKATMYDKQTSTYEVRWIDKTQVDYVDAYSNTMTSMAAACVPFLEHNEGTRVAMGANMLRQAVPLQRSESPLVGTGIENHLAIVSNACITSDLDGTVYSVDGSYISIKPESGELDDITIYPLSKFQASNQNTCINYRPVVNVGDIVRQGDIIADGTCSDQGEIALGKNLRVGFMTWDGYNYEDAIIINERLVRSGDLTSVHLFTLTCDVYENDHGQEEITRDIDSLSYKERHALDEYGLPIIGATVKGGDVLVGKVSPKPENRQDPETQILHSLFDVYANPYRDSSMRVPDGKEGRIIKVDVVYGESYNGERNLEFDDLDWSSHALITRFKILRDTVFDMLVDLVKGEHSTSMGKVVSDNDVPSSGKKKWFQKLKMRDQYLNIQIRDAIEFLDDEYENARDKVKEHSDIWSDRHKNLQTEVIATVSVTIAAERKIQVGDKLSGRHGNKGVISKIVPDEDMPYDSNGNTLDVILSPLGIPSRMNAGQLLETNMGLAVKRFNDVKPNKRIKLLRKLKNESDIRITKITAESVAKRGLRISTPPFNSATEDYISQLLTLSGDDASDQIELWDGRTGRKFDRPITVGWMYLMKLHHMVDDKLHGRSTGPYDRVTQQPLRGKALNGGQRLGEMEVWAIEAYGSAYLLQEMITIKSDHPRGREEIIKEITKNGGKPPEFKEFLDGDLLYGGNSEIFKVLSSELRSLGIDINWVDPNKTKPTMRKERAR